MRRFCILVSALAFVGCGETLDPRSLLTEQRPVGVISQVEGDPTRSNPRPGETVNLEWVSVQPSGEHLPIGWAVGYCRPAPVTVGFSFCRETPFAFDAQAEPTAEPPRQQIAIPEDYTEPSLLVTGIFCLDGTVDLLAQPNPEDLGASCMSGDPLLVTYVVAVDQEGAPNHNPELEEISLRTEPWTASAPPGSRTCEGLSLPEFSVEGEEEDILLRATAASRESYTDGEETVVEELENELIATAGAWASGFVFMEDEGVLEETGKWTPPTRERLSEDGISLTPEGMVVRFYFILRDGRDGFAITERAACVRP